MNGSATLPIALGFVLGIIPFVLWTCWLLRDDRTIREAELFATPHAQARRRFTPSGETVVGTPSARGIRARWRREQMAA
jgi:hypothetical protein